MKRIFNNQDKKPVVEKIEKIDLDHSHKKRKVVLLIVFLVIAIGSLTYFLFSLLSPSSNYETVYSSYSYLNQDISLDYYFYGSFSDRRNTERALKEKYSEATKTSYFLFSDMEESPDFNNIKYINAHPNEDIKISKYLYDTLKAIDSHSNVLYMAPINVYYNLAITSDDNDFSYYLSELDSKFSLYTSYCLDRNHVKLEFKEDNVVNLFVSNEYLEFLNEDDTETVISISNTHLMNAIYLDYITQELDASGFKFYRISSVDGYMKLGELVEGKLTEDLYDYKNDKVQKVAEVTYNPYSSVINLTSFPLTSLDSYKSNGVNDKRVSYFIKEDGTSISQDFMIKIHSNNTSLLDILLEVNEPLLSLNYDGLRNVMNYRNYHYLYIKDRIIFYNSIYLKPEILADSYKSENLK